MVRVHLLDDDLWVVNRRFCHFGLPFESRMTIVRLGNGGLWLHSPVAPLPEVHREVAALGRVRELVAPNQFHHLFADAWRELYPDARLHGAPGLPAKRKDVTFDTVLENGAPKAWLTDLDQQVIGGMPRLCEVAFLHHRSRTLILSDLIANVGRESPWAMRGWMMLNRAYGRPASTTFVRAMVNRRSTARDSLRRVMAWDFDRVVMGHGGIIERDGKAVLRAALAWLLE